MNWNQALFPSLKRRGGCAIKKMSRSNLSSRLFINAAATPPFQGGECVRTETVCQFIHTFSALGRTTSDEQPRRADIDLPPFQGFALRIKLSPRACALG